MDLYMNFFYMTAMIYLCKECIFAQKLLSDICLRSEGS